MRHKLRGQEKDNEKSAERDGTTAKEKESERGCNLQANEKLSRGWRGRVGQTIARARAVLPSKSLRQTERERECGPGRGGDCESERGESLSAEHRN